jgi:hypothetical protein
LQGGFGIASGVVTVLGAGQNDALYNAISFPNDQWSSIIYSQAGGNASSYITANVRMSAGDNGYIFDIVPNSGSWLMRKLTGGSATNIASGTFGAISLGTTVLLQVQGSTLTAFNGTTQITQQTDTTYTSGAPGIGGYLTTTSWGFGTWTAGGFAAPGGGQTGLQLAMDASLRNSGLRH